MADCIFCLIAVGKIPSLKVHEDAHTLAFMDNNPGTEGHVLVIPKTHADDIFAIEDHALAAVMHTAKRVSSAAKSVLGVAGVNLFQSNGAVAGQSVFHLHVHVLPRFAGDKLRLPWIPGEADKAALGVLAQRLRAAIA